MAKRSSASAARHRRPAGFDARANPTLKGGGSQGQRPIDPESFIPEQLNFIVDRDQLVACVREFKLTTKKEIHELLAGLVEESTNYRLANERTVGKSDSRDRERLKKLGRSAEELRKRLSDEPLFHAIYLIESLRGNRNTQWPVINGTDPIAAYRDMAVLSDYRRELDILLARIGQSTATLADDRVWLRTITGRSLLKDAHKSLERVRLWEPFFGLWVYFGNTLSFSEGGPLWRALDSYHRAVGVGHSPEMPALKKAIREYREYKIGSDRPL